MAQSSAHRSSHQNSHDNQDELASGTATGGSDRCTPARAATQLLIPAIAPIVAPLVASGSADSSVVRYLEDDFQRIFKTVLDFRPLALVPAPIVTAAPYYESPHKRPLKTRFPNIYYDKTHLECYNFFQ